MRHGRALKHLLVAGLFGLLAFAPGLLLPWSAKAGGDVGLAQDGFAIDQFYDELAPYGEWIEHPSYGYVWLPRAVAPDWRPYTVGNWVDTEEYGWYWDSPEPFAWAVYHYGRWSFDPDYGWYWVPGDTWAPAWVQWRYGDEYVGWAPEVPVATGGYVYGGPARYAPPPPQDSWVFVQPRYLASPGVRNYAVPRTSISIAFIRSTNVYRPAYRNGYVYNYGMPRDRWSRLTHQRIEPRKIYRGHSRARPHDWKGRGRRDLYVYAPGVKKGAGPRRPPKKVSHKPSKTKANARAAHANAAKAKAVRARRPVASIPNYRGQGLRAPDRRPLAYGGGQVPQVKGPSAKPKAANAKPAAKSKAYVSKSNAAKSNAAKAKARAQYQRRATGAASMKTVGRPSGTIPTYRGQGLRGPDHRPLAYGGGQAPQGKGPSAKGPSAKPKAAKSKAASKPKAVAKPKSNANKANIAKANAAKAQAARVRAANAKAANAKSAHAKAAHAKAGKPKPKWANAKPGPGPGGNGKPSAGKSGGGKGGGGNRAAACKANPNLPICGRRG